MISIINDENDISVNTGHKELLLTGHRIIL
jgi:hypothetical protein